MIDPVSQAAPPVPAAGRTAGAERGRSPPSQPAAAKPSLAPEPLALDVAQGADGVFVYTLSDPGTGTVVAVIPREQVRQGRDGRNVDQRV